MFGSRPQYIHESSRKSDGYDGPVRKSMAQSKSGLGSSLPAQSYHNHGSKYSGSKTVTSQNLEVPFAHRPRPSVDSTCSELSIFSNELAGPGQALLDDSLPEGLPGLVQRPGFLAAFWFRNKGAIYVLLSQLFGSGMNLATRILENPGGHGKGMHPFQVHLSVHRQDLY